MGLHVIKQPPLIRECAAECIGTYILVFFGLGSVHVAVLTGSLAGLWQVAMVWAVAVAMAIYTVGAISGAHINPAITLAFAAYRQFAWRKVPWYILWQCVGAFAAAATLYLLFANIITDFETAQHITRGAPGSELSAMIYGEYFPNPAIAKAMHWTPQVVKSSARHSWRSSSLPSPSHVIRAAPASIYCRFSSG
jgi:glycerol uptake facilitator protein